MAVVKLCCEDCMKPKKGGFRKVLCLEKSSLSIYNYNNPYHPTDEDGTIIVHNASDNDLPNTQLLEDLHYYKTICSQCIEKVTRVRDILKQIPILKRNEVIGICDHCKTAKHLCCSRCKSITKSFLATKLREYQQRQYLLEQWIGKIQELLLLLLNGQIPCQRKACALSKSFMEMQKLLETPFTARELAIDTFPFDFNASEMTPEKIIERMTKNVYGGTKDQEADLKSIKSIDQVRWNERKKLQDLQNKEIVNLSESNNFPKENNIKRKIQFVRPKITVKGSRKKNGGCLKRKGSKGPYNADGTYKPLRVVKSPYKSKAFRHMSRRLEDDHSCERFIKVSKQLNKKTSQVKTAKSDKRSEISFVTTPRFTVADEHDKDIMFTMDKSKSYPRSKAMNVEPYGKVKTSAKINQNEHIRTMSDVAGKEKKERYRLSHNGDKKSAVGKLQSNKLDSEKSNHDSRSKGDNADGINIIFNRQKSIPTKKKRALYSEDVGRKRHKTDALTPSSSKDKEAKWNARAEIVVMSPEDKVRFDDIMKQSGFEKEIIQYGKSTAMIYSSPKLGSSKKDYSIETLTCKERKTNCTKCIRSAVVLPKNARNLISPPEVTPRRPLVYENNYAFTEPELFSKTIRKSVEIDSTEEKSEMTASGILSYRLSDQKFIKNGWTQLPVQKSFRRLCVHRMVPTDVGYDWFLRHKGKVLFYNTGEVLAEVDNFGSGRWLYKNGRVALHFEKHEEVYGFYGKFVIYSDGEAQSYLNKPSPISILATFDYLGNGVVYSQNGQVRLEYNQYKGRTVDPDLGPPGKWKWNMGSNHEHSIDEVQLREQHNYDSDIQKLILKHEAAKDLESQDPEELDLEYKKLSQEMPGCSMLMPLQIRRLKCCKINKYLTLRVIDQQHIYLNFRHGISSLKVNIGMKIVANDVLGIVLEDPNEISNLYVRPSKPDPTVTLNHTDIGKNKARKR